VRRENAGRTGYSWSVIMTATAGISQAPLYWETADLQVALHLPCCIRALYIGSLGHSGVRPEPFVRRPSW
jgi:hypothetical protein